MPNGASVCFAVTTLAFIDGREAQAGDTTLPTGILRIASDQDYPADHRSEQIHEIPRLRVSVSLQFRVFGAGLLQSELDGEVSATRGPRDSDAGLRRDACGLAGLTGDGPAAAASRKQIVNDVGVLRRDGEMKSYIDLLFLALVVLL